MAIIQHKFVMSLFGSTNFDIPLIVKKEPLFGDAECAVFLMKRAQAMCHVGQIVLRYSFSAVNHQIDLDVRSAAIKPLTAILYYKPDRIFVHVGSPSGTAAIIPFWHKVLYEMYENPFMATVGVAGLALSAVALHYSNHPKSESEENKEKTVSGPSQSPTPAIGDSDPSSLNPHKYLTLKDFKSRSVVLFAEDNQPDKNVSYTRSLKNYSEKIQKAENMDDAWDNFTMALTEMWETLHEDLGPANSSPEGTGDKSIMASLPLVPGGSLSTGNSSALSAPHFRQTKSVSSTQSDLTTSASDPTTDREEPFPRTTSTDKRILEAKETFAMAGSKALEDGQQDTDAFGELLKMGYELLERETSPNNVQACLDELEGVINHVKKESDTMSDEAFRELMDDVDDVTLEMLADHREVTKSSSHDKLTSGSAVLGTQGFFSFLETG